MKNKKGPCGEGSVGEGCVEASGVSGLSCDTDWPLFSDSSRILGVGTKFSLWEQWGQKVTFSVRPLASANRPTAASQTRPIDFGVTLAP